MRKISKISRFLPESLLKKMRGRQTETEKLGLIWHKIVGQDLAAHSAPASYQNGVLTVLADNAIWASKMRHNLPAIIKKCCKQENLRALTRIKIKIGVKNNTVETVIKPAPRTTRISKSSATLILESAKHIADETLRASLERLGSNVRDYKNKNE
jgi:hypothetical protein